MWWTKLIFGYNFVASFSHYHSCIFSINTPVKPLAVAHWRHIFKNFVLFSSIFRQKSLILWGASNVNINVALLRYFL